MLLVLKRNSMQKVSGCCSRVTAVPVLKNTLKSLNYKLFYLPE